MGDAPAMRFEPCDVCGADDWVEQPLGWLERRRGTRSFTCRSCGHGFTAGFMFVRAGALGRVGNAYRRITNGRRILFHWWIYPAGAAIGAVLGLGLAALTGWPWWIAVLAALSAFGLWLGSVIDGLRIRRRLGRSPGRDPRVPPR